MWEQTSIFLGTVLLHEVHDLSYEIQDSLHRSFRVRTLLQGLYVISDDIDDTEILRKLLRSFMTCLLLLTCLSVTD